MVEKGREDSFYGQACYFAVNARYSHHYSHVVRPSAGECHRQLLLVKVLCGVSKKYTQGAIDRDMSRSALQNEYDSVLGGPHRPALSGAGEDDSEMVVVYKSSQTMPEFLITYRTEENNDTSSNNSMAVPSANLCGLKIQPHFMIRAILTALLIVVLVGALIYVGMGLGMLAASDIYFWQPSQGSYFDIAFEEDEALLVHRATGGHAQEAGRVFAFAGFTLALFCICCPLFILQPWSPYFFYSIVASALSVAALLNLPLNDRKLIVGTSFATPLTLLPLQYIVQCAASVATCVPAGNQLLTLAATSMVISTASLALGFVELSQWHGLPAMDRQARCPADYSYCPPLGHAHWAEQQQQQQQHRHGDGAVEFCRSYCNFRDCRPDGKYKEGSNSWAEDNCVGIQVPSPWFAYCLFTIAAVSLVDVLKVLFHREQRRKAGTVLLEGQEQGESQSDVMGQYLLVQGKEINGRGVWYCGNNRGGGESFLWFSKYYPGKLVQDSWWVTDRASMAARKTSGWLHVESAVYTPGTLASGTVEMGVGREFKVKWKRSTLTCVTAESSKAWVDAPKVRTTVQQPKPRDILLAGQVQDDPQSGRMGMYQLMEGTEISWRGVWQRRAGGGQESYLWFYSKTSSWWVTDRASMEARSAHGWLHVASIALSPDKITQTWKVFAGADTWVDAPKVRAIRPTVVQQPERREVMQEEQPVQQEEQPVLDVRQLEQQLAVRAAAPLEGPMCV
jgi:hypothetical protein